MADQEPQGSFRRFEEHRRRAHERRTRRSRLAWIVVMWIVALPAYYLMIYHLKWVGLLIIAGAAWVSWDYYRAGDMLGPIEGSQREGLFLPPWFTKKS